MTINYSIPELKHRAFLPIIRVTPYTKCAFSYYQVEGPQRLCEYYGCQYCNRLPSEGNRLICTLAINHIGLPDFDGLGVPE